MLFVAVTVADADERERGELAAVGSLAVEAVSQAWGVPMLADAGRDAGRVGGGFRITAWE